MRRLPYLLAVPILLVAGCDASQTSGEQVPAPPTQAAAGQTPAPAPSPGRSGNPATPPTDAAPGAVPVPQLRPVEVPASRRPVRLLIPSIGVDTSLERLGISADRTIEVPKNPDLAGWLTAASAPGDPGPAVMAGHVDSTTGPAVFYRLSELTAGQAVSIRRADGSTARFQVDTVEQVSRTAFPTARVYGPTPVPSLRLITCAGPYDRSSGYRDNIVVFASRVTD